MKIGDKLVCIKNRYNLGRIIVNEKNKIYNIVKIKDYRIYLNSDDGVVNLYYYTVIGDSLEYYIREYFILLKEHRKQKLEKLNEI